MGATAVLEWAERLGVRLAATEEGGLAIDRPADLDAAEADALIAALKVHKAAILAERTTPVARYVASLGPTAPYNPRVHRVPTVRTEPDGTIIRIAWRARSDDLP